ncbi:YfiR family protein [Kaarinaea lacus]
MNTRIIFISALLIYFYLIPDSVYSASQTYDEYAIKTAFLFRSLHYVEWGNKNVNNKSIVICVTEPDNFSETIYSLHHRTVNGRTIVLRKLASYSDIHECDVLQIPALKTPHLDQTLNKLANNNILTISDHRGFAQHGVVLNFPVESEKVIIEINIDAANKQNIKFSAKLLRIAKIVGYK